MKHYDESLNQSLIGEFRKLENPTETEKQNLYLALYNNNESFITTNLVYYFKGLISYDEVKSFIYEQIAKSLSSYDDSTSFVHYLKNGTFQKIIAYLNYNDTTIPIHVPVRKKEKYQETIETINIEDYDVAEDTEEEEDYQNLMDLIDSYLEYVKNTPHTKGADTAMQVVRLMAQGKTNGDIAEELGLAKQTVSVRIHNGIKRLKEYRQSLSI